MTQLLIGCGNRRNKQLGFDLDWTDLVTMDHDPNCGADIVHDLDVLPWPVASDSCDEVHAYCVLEHLGTQGDYRSFFALFGEIYRVLQPGGHLFAICPSRHSPWAWGDPSHTRLIQREHLVFLDQTEYAKQIGKTSMTDFRWLWSGDFEVVASEDDGKDHKFALKAHKPARYPDTTNNP